MPLMSLAERTAPSVVVIILPSPRVLDVAERVRQHIGRETVHYAGREIRIIVESERISDEETVWLSKDIARRIENELEYPGQIKVTVIRETRAVEFAR